MNDYNFGNFVCALREKKGLTQADLAGQLGVTPAAISKWENGSSKPRVEMLFQLAEILGVSPEELMAGHYLEKEHLDPESIKMINEKYEYLRRIELHNTSKTKIFRLLAWIIDWNMIGFITLSAVSLFISFFADTDSSLTESHILLLMLLMLSYPICFVLRDLIFGGRSLGKRIMGLTILDKKTGATPKKTTLFIRNIFLFIVHIETVIMLVTGLTLGDRAAHTVVVRKKDLAPSKDADSIQQNTEIINQFASNQAVHIKSKKKQTVMWICIIAAAVLLFVGFIMVMTTVLLNKAKESEEYKLAYSYVIESEKFKELGIEENKLKFTSYSLNSYTDEESITRHNAEIIFNVKPGHDLTVILHDENNQWYVCKECTGFE